MIKDVIRNIHFQFQNCEGGLRTDGVSSDVEVTVKGADMVLCSVFSLLHYGIHVLAESIHKTPLGCRCRCLNGQLPESSKPINTRE
jgi:hypothetical protein